VVGVPEMKPVEEFRLRPGVKMWIETQEAFGFPVIQDVSVL
jgi:hypothetical protein